jgi:5-methylcytosine-specific restriction endonuclease McrA
VRICSGPGCLRAVSDGVRFCDECKPQAADGDGIRSHTWTDRERYAFLYSGARWTKLARQVTADQPLCARCGQRLTALIDHVVPAGVAVQQAADSGRYFYRYAGFFLRSNLQGLCRPCHIQKTIEDKAHTGPWLSVVEREQKAKRKVWTF